MYFHGYRTSTVTIKPSTFVQLGSRIVSVLKLRYLSKGCEIINIACFFQSNSAREISLSMLSRAFIRHASRL